MDTDLLIMRIKSLCSDRGITMTTAFIESGVGKNFKSNFPSVSKKNLSLLANYFNVSVEYLTGEESDEEYTGKIVRLVIEWLEDNGYDYSEDEYDIVVISKDNMCVKYAKCDFATVCKSIKTSSETDAFNLAMIDWERRSFRNCTNDDLAERDLTAVVENRAFKERFNKLCAEKGMSPNAVCSLIGLSNSAYSKWTENSIPRATVLIKLSEFFGVSVAYLKGEEKERKPDTATLDTSDLSAQEQALIKLFREVTEESRLEMIASVINIRNKI